jgi:hypothetical protein
MRCCSSGVSLGGAVCVDDGGVDGDGLDCVAGGGTADVDGAVCAPPNVATSKIPASKAIRFIVLILHYGSGYDANVGFLARFY